MIPEITIRDYLADPFLSDPAYINNAYCLTHDMQQRTIVVISRIGNAMLVWVVEEKRLVAGTLETEPERS